MPPRPEPGTGEADSKAAGMHTAAAQGVATGVADATQLGPPPATTHTVIANFAMPMAFAAAIATGGVADLRVEILEPLPESHPVYALVGRVASEWSHFEGVLDTIIWKLARLPAPLGAAITAQIMGAGNRLVTIRSLATEVMLLDQIHDDLKTLEGRTFKWLKPRNRTVHDPWFWEIHSHETKQQRSMPKEELVFGMVPIGEDELKDKRQCS